MKEEINGYEQTIDIVGVLSSSVTSTLLIYPIKNMEVAFGNTVKSSNSNTYSKYSFTSNEGNVNSTSIIRMRTIVKRMQTA